MERLGIIWQNGGKCDFKQLKEFQKKLEKLEKTNVTKFCEDCAKELAARLLSKVIKMTPVGTKPEVQKKSQKYTSKRGKSKSFLTAEGAMLEKYWSGYIGGTLRRGWIAKTHQEAENGTESTSVTDIEKWTNSARILKMGNNFIIFVQNPVYYSSYVEFGHRQTPGRYVPAIGKRLKSSWTEGKFMLTISEKELESELPRLIEKKLNVFLGECFNGNK